MLDRPKLLDLLFARDKDNLPSPAIIINNNGVNNIKSKIWTYDDLA